MKKLKYYAGIASCLIVAFSSASTPPHSTVEEQIDVKTRSSVEEMIEKLFLRLDVRHREILSIEENITHNRSSIEKESLSRILEQKVRDFVSKDAMVTKAIDRLKNSANKDNVFLYRKSMDRLDHYRKNIDQIQELYFRKPVVVSPEIKIETGNENFENFLSSWESRKPLRNTERRTERAVVPSKEVEYFAHVKREAQDNQTSASYNDFLEKLSPSVAQGNLEAVPSEDKAKVDKFHNRLTQEPRSSIPKFQQDQSFSNFFDKLEKDVTNEQKNIEISKIPDTSSEPFDVQKRYLRQLDEPAAEVDPLSNLMSDLERMTAHKKATQKASKAKDQGRTFSKFYDQLELSQSQKDAQQRDLRTHLSSDKEFDQFVAKAEQTLESQSTEFSDLHQALSQPKKAQADETLQETGAIELPRHPVGKARTSFVEMFAAIPSTRVDQGAVTENPAEVEKQANTNRFRVILNSLKKDNQKAMLEAEYIDADEKILETELAAVFPDKIKTKDAANSDIVQSEVIRFDQFPGNIHGEVESRGLEMHHFSTSETDNTSASQVDENTQAEQLASLVSQDNPLPSRSDEGSAYNNALGYNESIAKSDTSEDEDTEDAKGHDGKIHPRSIRLARQAEARLLRKEASLIPITIETRDQKDRLYTDLPIEFEVEMQPRNFISGHILDSYVNSPWRHTVKTNIDGIAAIHLLLDLKGKEVNISRTLETSTKRTICKVLITPKY